MLLWSFQFGSSGASGADWCLSLHRGDNAGLLQMKLVLNSIEPLHHLLNTRN